MLFITNRRGGGREREREGGRGGKRGQRGEREVRVKLVVVLSAQWAS